MTRRHLSLISDESGPALGLNNNQVARRMYIRTHTVAHHLRQAFRKLHITTRVELARIVIEGAAHRS